MLRTALKPRWLALLAVVLAAAAVMARLGEWQLDRARQKGERDRIRAAQARPPVSLTSILTPRAPFPDAAADRRVTVEGTWDASRQLLVPGRRVGDRTGYWVLTPLLLADGSAVPVVRGWVPDAGDPRADPGASPGSPGVAVEGVVEPSEAVTDLAPGDASSVPPGQVALVAAPLLVQKWPYPLITGFVVQTGVRPEPTGQAAARAAVAPGTGGGLALQNLSYALQWWLFSAFGIFLWWRIVRDDRRGRLRPAPAGADPPPAPEAEYDDEPVPTPDAGEPP
ncbi:MAG: SURF1 family protein [Kineosporiaceae bacterium]